MLVISVITNTESKLGKTQNIKARIDLNIDA